MKHTNKLILLSAILVIILCLSLVSCRDSGNESLSTDDNKVDNTSVVGITEETESTTNLGTDSSEETSSVQKAENTDETTVTHETENDEPYEIKVDDYTLIKNENGCYLTFDDISKYQSNSNSSMEVANVEFSSIKEFKDRVTKGLLTNGEKNIVADFSKYDNGYIKMCDFNNLYEPMLPQGSTIPRVLWEADSYSFEICRENIYYGYLLIMTKEGYTRIYENEYENALNKDTITITKTEEIDGKCIIYYKTSAASIRLERYTLYSGDKTIIVDKKFVLEGHPLLNPSETVPINIRMYCNEGNKYYIVNIDTVYEDPTDGWLLEFGLKPYIENDHEVM